MELKTNKSVHFLSKLEKNRNQNLFEIVYQTHLFSLLKVFLHIHFDRIVQTQNHLKTNLSSNLNHKVEITSQRKDLNVFKFMKKTLKAYFLSKM